ncbi:MAG: MCE family protein [Calditrichaeota bacterium]|nr:MAG: MCE family protein [Calditrichota bacterium]
MPTRAQKIRLGIFVVFSVAALIILVAFFTSEKFLQKKDTYYIAYKDISVSGLEEGSPVKYLGVKVGTVKDIRIDPEDVSRVIVKVELKAGTPIKKDAHADIVAMGITGLKMIEIRGASKEAPLLEKGSYIPAGSSISEQITGKAEIIAEKAERVLNNLQKLTTPENLQKIIKMSENAASAFEKLDSILGENRNDLREAITSTQSIAARLDTTAQIFYESAQKIRSIVYGDTLKQILSSTREISQKLKEADLGNLIKELGTVADQTNQLLIQVNRNLDRGSIDILHTLRELRSTIENLHEISRAIRDDPSILVRGTELKDTPDRFVKD